MRRPSLGTTISLVAHGLVLALTLVSLPFLRKNEPMLPPTLSVDVIDVSELAQAPKTDAPKQNVIRKPAAAPEPVKKAPPPPKKEAPPPPKPEPPKPAPEPKPEPPKKVEPPKPKPEPVKKDPPPKPKAEKKPEPKPPVKKEPEKKEPPKKVEKKPEPKPEPKKVEQPAPKKEPPKEPQSREDFSDSILKTLNKSAPQTDAPPANTPPAAAASGDSLSNVLTADALGALKRQIGRCWNFPAGASGADALIVVVRVTMNPDRTVRNAVIAQGAPSSHPMARQANESALRAVLSPACSPLLLPPDGYAQWQNFTLRFDPRMMLGG